MRAKLPDDRLPTELRLKEICQVYAQRFAESLTVLFECTVLLAIAYAALSSFTGCGRAIAPFLQWAIVIGAGAAMLLVAFQDHTAPYAARKLRRFSQRAPALAMLTVMIAVACILWTGMEISMRAYANSRPHSIDEPIPAPAGPPAPWVPKSQTTSAPRVSPNIFGSHKTPD